MIIKILGSGCKKCLASAKNAKDAAQTMGVDAHIEKVTNIFAIAGHGIMSKLGPVINDKVVSRRRVISASEMPNPNVARNSRQPAFLSGVLNQHTC
ncbi:MAG: thioredoxin family protein [Yoonia sp.]|nr:thioredoxin family protein [Yoonia sp.]